MPCAHRLHGLAFAAIRRPPQRPMLARADCIAAIPELSGNSAVTGVFDHAAFFATLDLPSNFGRKLKMITPVVDGPRSIRLHQNRIVGIRYQIVVFPGARIQADVRHANDRQPIPCFSTHRAVRPCFSDR